MTETRDHRPPAHPEPLLAYLHDECDQCPLPSVKTAHLSTISRSMVDAMGDIHLHLIRDPEGNATWEVDVQVYSADTPPGGVWDVEHLATTGVPSYMPPNCPEWLWMLYVAVGDMCTHFMDLHDPVGVESAAPEFDNGATGQ